MSAARCQLPLLVIGMAIGAPVFAQTADSTKYLGVSSCTAAACHGSPQQQDRPAWQSAYTVWFGEDPHSSAFATLWSDRSRQIVNILAGEATSQQTHARLLRERCIVCHATPTASPSLASLAEGVSCQSCHGPAAGWIHEHTRAGWTKLTLQEKRSYGMVNTPDLYERSLACTRCHVGPADAGGRLFDVNHDLIAAGHPRLAFDFPAYLAHLPPHWDATRDREFSDKAGQTPRRDFEVEAWLAGQLAQARAALALLQARAASAKTSETTAWPEFAEYDCNSCHHLLRPDHALGGNRGTPVWGTWQRALGQLPGNLEALNAEMAKLLPDPGTTAQLASDGRLTMDRLAPTLLRESQLPERSKLLADLAREAGNLRGWDETAGWYLAVAALSGAYREGTQADASLRQSLAAFRKRLEEPSPDMKTTYEFKPDHPAFRQALEELLEQLK
jgi:hypothetical protein